MQQCYKWGGDMCYKGASRKDYKKFCKSCAFGFRTSLTTPGLLDEDR